MKRLLAILLFGICLMPLFSHAEKIKVTLDFRHFYNPEQGNYLETMMHFGGYSMKYKENASGVLQGKLNITQVFRIGDSVVAFKKYEVLTPEVEDSVYSDFYDIQRFQLAPGDYTYDITIEDVYAKKAKEKTIEHTQPLEILDYSNKVVISRPEYIEQLMPTETPNMFSKSGVDIIPYISDYFPAALTNMAYYSELYFHSDTNAYVLKQSIQTTKGEEVFGNLFTQKRIKAQPVVPIVNKFDISELPSGDFFLVIEVVDRENKTVVKKKEFFQRTNPFLAIDPEDLNHIEVAQNFKTIDSVFYYLESLIPITGKAEQKNIITLLREADSSKARTYIYQFWRKTTPTDAWFGYLNYKKQVQKAENLFGTNIRKGFQSDRGRVFLQYGDPDSRFERENEPNSYPYEIWHYYKIGDQSNRKFVFYNPSLVNGYYDLLHSNMRGELQNANWASDLRNRNTSPSQRQNGEQQDTFGGDAEDWFYNHY